jgi:peptidoglycan hydrolase-like protein with peptidoglycan-binding domain
MSEPQVSAKTNTPVNLVKAVLAPSAQTQVPAMHPRFKNDSTLAAVNVGKASLQSGSRGEAVEKIQQTLNDMGFYAGDHNDGIFGRQTSTAVKNFQSHCKLPQTGVLDQKTFEQLNKRAPEPGKKLWDSPAKDKYAPANDLGKLGKARAVVDLSEHRLFLYDDKQEIKKIYSIAAGDPNNPNGRGQKTGTGVRKVFEKIADPSPYARAAWPESQGKAFGTRLLDLHALVQKTGKWKDTVEEVHGTFARSSIGTDASSGCIRMQNEDIEEVFEQFKNGDLIKIQD